MLYLIQSTNHNNGRTRTLSAREFAADEVREMDLTMRAHAMKEMLRVTSLVADIGEMTLTMNNSMDIDLEIDWHTMEVTLRTSAATHTIALVPVEAASDADDGDEDDEADEAEAKPATTIAGRCGECGHNAYNHNTDETWCEVCDDECVFRAEGLAASLR